MKPEVIQSFEQYNYPVVKPSLFDIKLDKWGIEIWYNRVLWHRWTHTKTFRVSFHPKHWRFVDWHSNGAKKGRLEDKCFDITFRILGLWFNYTDWDYNSKYRNENDQY